MIGQPSYGLEEMPSTLEPVGEAVPQVGGALGLMMKGASLQEQMGSLAEPAKMAMYNNFRYQNTMLKGGFYDEGLLSRGKVGKALGRDKFRIFKNAGAADATALEARSFAFGSKFGRATARGTKMLNTAGQAGAHSKYAMSAGFRANYLNPTHYLSGRFHSASVFGAAPGNGYYSPFQGGFLATTGNQIANAPASISRMLTKKAARGPAAEKKVLFNGGVTGRLGAITRSERGRLSQRTMGKFDRNLARTIKMNSSIGKEAFYSTDDIIAQLRSGQSVTGEQVLARQSTEAKLFKSLMGADGAAPMTAGGRRLATTEGMIGTKSKAFTRNILTSGGGIEMRTGKFGQAGVKSLSEYAVGETVEMTAQFGKMANPLIEAIGKNSDLFNTVAAKGFRPPVSPFSNIGATATTEAIEMAAKHEATVMGAGVIEKGMFKSLGVRGTGAAIKTVGKEVGAGAAARLAAVAGGEAVLAAIPGVNLIFAADMAYNLAKLAGHGIKAGINLAKDGVKSMSGTMNNGIMGNGYKDNEVAATSRARGVAAIQNSRLNARSLLGNEGAMMHAHFG